MKVGNKLTLFLSIAIVLPMVLATPTSSVPMTAQMKLKILSPKDYAAHVALHKYGWGQTQHKCLKALWGKESAWNYLAKSKTKDYGIPQRHMSQNTKIEIQDFLRSPQIQIEWGLNYINNRYGSPCKAWAFHNKNNWY